MFTIIPILIAVGFAVVIGMIIFRSVQGAARWHKNNESPVLTASARVVSKRQETHVSGGAGDTSATSVIRYFVTFETDGGARHELPVKGEQFGQLVEKDRGELTYQGTRFKGFNRQPGPTSYDELPYPVK